MPEGGLDYLETEFAPHYNAWKAAPHPEHAGKLLDAVRPVIDSALRTYVGPKPSPTMRGKAKLMALDAIGKYDPTRSRLRTHLMGQLQGLRRAGARESQILSVPEQVGLDQHHVRESEAELRELHGREPTEEELSDRVGLSRPRLAHLRKSRGVLAQGTIHAATSGEAEDLYDPAVAQRGAPDAWHTFVHGGLGPVDKRILEHTLGMHGKPVLQNQEIAMRVGLSPGAVSQRKAKIQQMLNSRDDLGVL